MPRRFAVILAADVVDYSLMMGEDEEATIDLIRDLRNASLEPIAKSHGGEVLKRMGDGWIFAFSSVSGAVTAAIEAQKGLAGHPQIRVRMGIHMGDITEDEEDIYGAGVNLAARLQTEAPPGGVMISADIYRQLSAKQMDAFADAGTFKLKNIVLPIQGYQWRVDSAFARQRVDEVPVIAVEAFGAAPADEETTSAASDLREQILHCLTRRTGLKVRDASREAVEDATYALRGRLRHSGGRARANLSLMLTTDGSTCWMNLYDGDAEDLYAFCDEVAAKADSELRLFINSLDNVRIADVADEKLSVSELRTRGAGLFYECTIPDLERCLSVMTRARRLSPDDGMALSMWAVAVNMLISIRFELPDENTVAELTMANDRAVELMPQSDFVFFTRCLFRASILRDPERTMADARRAYTLNPNYPQARIALGYGHVLVGDFSRSVVEFEAGTQQAKDTYWAYRVFHKAVAQFCGEDHVGAIATLRDIIDLKPSVRGFRKLLILSLRAMGDDAKADQEEALARELPDEPNFFVQEPPLPDSHIWLRDKLAPGSG
jgi:class 3 adenylate cyclase